MAQATTAAAPAAETRANTFLAKVNLPMLVGIAVTGVVSYWVSENMQFKSLLTPNLALVWGLFIVQVIKETKNVTSN
jgi:FtsH-binding integral membrane protein